MMRMRSNSFPIFLASLATLLTASAVGCGKTSMSADPRPDLAKAEELRKGAGGAAGGTEATQSTATGWGTLKGRFVYDGTAPAPTKIDIQGKDPDVCGKHPLLNDTLVVGKDGGLANVVIFARKVSRVNDEGAAPPATPFDQKDCQFAPHVYAVRTGQPMVMKNSDPTGHNINMSPAGNSPFNSTIPGGDSANYTFTQQLAKPASAVCNIHPWMASYIIARKDPYFAVTGSDGSFEIKNLPAGEPIEFQVWHERAQDGLAAKPDWNRGVVKLTLAADKDNTLGPDEVIKVSPSALK